MGIKTTFAALLCVGSLVASGAMAQSQSTNRVAQKTNWSVFVEDNPTECWSVSEPTESLISNEEAIRSIVQLIVAYRPSTGAKGQIAFTGGYPYEYDSKVNLDINGDKFKMYTDGEWAWPEDVSEDAKIVAAMKRGAKAILTGFSTRGTKTTDTFSLLGFTAAVEEAEKRCGG